MRRAVAAFLVLACLVICMASLAGCGEEESAAPEPGQVQRAAPAASGSFNGAPLKEYSNERYRYRVPFPAGWARSEEEVSYGYRVRWDSPEGSSHFLVDSSHTGGTEDPCAWPRSAHEEYLGSDPSYRLMALEPTAHRGCPACLWEYSLGDNSTLDFFVEGEEFGYAILFEAPSPAYRRLSVDFKTEIVDGFVPDRRF